MDSTGNSLTELEQPTAKRARIESGEEPAKPTPQMPQNNAVASGTDSDKTTENEELSSAETELYDRQIRLWGVEAQKRLNNAKVLIIGMNGLGAEVAKNIILGGVNSVHLMDPQPVTELDGTSQFFVANAIGQNRALASQASAQRLNPMVAVTASEKSTTEEPDEFFRQFNVICSIENSKAENIRLSSIAREMNAAFFAADVLGLFGYIALDLGAEYKYTKERKILGGKSSGKGGEQTETVELETTYAPYKNLVIQDKDENPLWSGKRTPPTLFAFYVVVDFFEKFGRHPDPRRREEDLDELRKLRDAFCKRQGVSYDRVPDDLFEYVFGQVGPVCAITGGVLAQEIVKAISRKDEPLNNLFLYNPMIGTGVVVKAT